MLFIDDQPSQPRKLKLGALTVPTKLPTTDYADANSQYGTIDVQIVEQRRVNNDPNSDSQPAYKDIIEKPSGFEGTFPPQGVLKYPIYVITSKSSFNDASQSLKALAERGYIVGFSKSFWENTLKVKNRQSRQTRRELFRVFTSHNDKMGVDYDNSKQRYVAQYPMGLQFERSTYKKFLLEAARAHSGNQSLSEWYTKLAGKFSMPVKDNGNVLSFSQQVELPEQEQSRALKGVPLHEYNDVLNSYQQLESSHHKLARKNDQLEQKFNSLRGQAVIPLDHLAQLPSVVNDNMRLVKQHMPNQVELRYQRCLVDPSHPHCRGVRVPRLMAEETATYADYHSIDINATQFLTISNLELAVKDDCLTTTDSGLISQIMNNNVTEVAAVVGSAGFHSLKDDISVSVNAVMFDQQIQQFSDKFTQSIYDADQHFTRVVKVASCLSLIKTSTADTESGVLDMLYGQNGISVEQGHSLSSNLGRQSKQQKRLYLAQTEVGELRGRVGYVGQTNYRPFDERSFEYQSADSDKGRIKFLNYGHRAAALWVLVANPDGSADSVHYKLVPFRELTASNAVAGIAVESLTQRHSCLWYGRNINSNMNFTIEKTTHYEGIPDPNKAGFAQYQQASLSSGKSTMDVVAEIQPRGIFLGYAQHRTRLMSQMMANKSSGMRMGSTFWDESLFPQFAQMISYGADQLVENDATGIGAEVIADAVAAALSALVPSAAEFIIPGSQFLKPKIKEAGDYGLQRIKQWADAQRADTSAYDQGTMKGYGRMMIKQNIRGMPKMIDSVNTDEDSDDESTDQETEYRPLTTDGILI